MSHARIKLAIAALVVAAGVCVLAYEGIQKGGVHYMEVDAFLADPQLNDQRVQLRGTVAEQGLVIMRGEQLARFNLRGDQNRLAVEYHGEEAVPDLFKAGADVVVEGRRGKDGVFQADKIMTKCPSKYESAPKGSQGKPKAPASQPGVPRAEASRWDAPAPALAAALEGRP